VRGDLVLAAQLGGAVDRPRAGGVPLDVRARLGAVEDVVGRHVAEVGTRPAAGVGHPPGPEGVHSERSLGVTLAGVDRRPGAGVHHDVGSDREDRLVDGVALRDVERRVGGGHHLVPHGLAVQP
jgi:hypothetical protein